MQEEDGIPCDESDQLEKDTDAMGSSLVSPQQIAEVVFLDKGRIVGPREEGMHQEEPKQAARPDDGGPDREEAPAGMAGSASAQGEEFGGSPDRSGTPQDLEHELAGYHDERHEDQRPYHHGALQCVCGIAVLVLGVASWCMRAVVVTAAWCVVVAAAAAFFVVVRGEGHRLVQAVAVGYPG
mmetsp:Transcript_15222/g.35270  ORF Transcript_15222/g.35270 Transcript_15222/m.35270 type:complete len:182 (+) Transcript_15222:617-1162(+)